MPGYRPALLFPGDDAQVLTAYGKIDDTPLLLIVPDGTWRKARKLLYMNPLLEGVATGDAGGSRTFALSAAQGAGGGALSTIEAVVGALNALEQPACFDALLAPFEALIEGQIRAMGVETFQRNHGEG